MTGIRFLTRQGCPLCEEALQATIPLAASADVGVEVIDIDLDLDLLAKYNDRVPVIERSDGSVITEGIVDLDLIAAFLRNGP